MQNFLPTDDELFDYHLGIIEPKLARQIEAYLTTHPEAQTKLSEYAQIETGFSSFPITEPSDELVQRVLAIAEAKMNPGFFEKLQGLSWRRSLSWALMLALVVGLSSTFRGIRDQNTNDLRSVKMQASKVQDNTFSNGQAADFTGTLTQKVLAPVEVDSEQGKLFQTYITAVSFYEQSRFKEAGELFSQIITDHPDFDKRVELYNYWANSLEQSGDVTQANQKREELKKIQEEKSSTM